MLTQIINGRIFTPQGWLNEGSVLMRDGKILEVTNCDLALIGARLIDAKGMYIRARFRVYARPWRWRPRLHRMYRRSVPQHRQCTPRVMALRVSTPPSPPPRSNKLHQAAQVCEQLMAEPDSPVLGLHIEGPYLNKKMAGEQFAGPGEGD